MFTVCYSYIKETEHTGFSLFNAMLMAESKFAYVHCCTPNGRQCRYRIQRLVWFIGVNIYTYTVYYTCTYTYVCMCNNASATKGPKCTQFQANILRLPKRTIVHATQYVQFYTCTVLIMYLDFVCWPIFKNDFMLLGLIFHSF